MTTDAETLRDTARQMAADPEWAEKFAYAILVLELIIDEWCQQLSSSEFSVLMFIFRLTVMIGCDKAEIPQSSFYFGHYAVDDNVVLPPPVKSLSTLRKALRRMENMGLLEIDRPPRGPGRATIYRINPDIGSPTKTIVSQSTKFRRVIRIRKAS